MASAGSKLGIIFLGVSTTWFKFVFGFATNYAFIYVDPLFCFSPGRNRDGDIWVSGTNTGITYKNIYCAVCNGALVNHTTLSVPGTTSSDSDTDLSAVQFWWTNINCQEDVAKYLSTINNDATTTEELISDLFER